MSVHVSSQVWKLRTPDATTKLILLKLADNANEDGYCWPSLATICQETEIPKSTLCKRLNDLEEDGWITRIQGEKKSTLYRLTLPDPTTQAVSPRDTPCLPGGQVPVSPRDSTSLPQRHEPSENRQVTESEPANTFVPENFSGSRKAAEKNGKEKTTPRPPPNPDHQAFIDWWMLGFEERFGQPYDFQSARDGSNVKHLLSIMALGPLQFLVKNCWLGAGGFYCGQVSSLQWLRSHINEIRAEQSKAITTPSYRRPSSLI